MMMKRKKTKTKKKNMKYNENERTEKTKERCKTTSNENDDKAQKRIDTFEVRGQLTERVNQDERPELEQRSSKSTKWKEKK